MKKGTRVGPAVFMGSMQPRESAEKMTKLNLQMILEWIQKGTKVKRSSLEHNLQNIVNAMERADLLIDE